VLNALAGWDNQKPSFHGKTQFFSLHHLGYLLILLTLWRMFAIAKMLPWRRYINHLLDHSPTPSWPSPSRPTPPLPNLRQRTPIPQQHLAHSPHSSHPSLHPPRPMPTSQKSSCHPFIPSSLHPLIPSSLHPFIRYLRGMNDFVLTPLLFYVAIRALVKTKRARWILLIALAAGGVLVAGIGWWKWLQGTSIAADGINRLVGTHYSPNHTALYLLRTLFLLIGLQLSTRFSLRSGSLLVEGHCYWDCQRASLFCCGRLDKTFLELSQRQKLNF